MPSTLSGSRIRAARRRAGKTQVALAQAAGISPSYLNLIEHNRRRIGGTTLLSVAQALGLRPGDLAEGVDTRQLDELRSAAAEHPGAAVDPASAEALASRFPEWAQLTTDLSRQLRDQTRVIAALSDRLTHDPLLAENVHAMLSHITALRSTAGILAQVDDIPALQKRRFQKTMVQESERLSSTAQMLADYLGAATDPGATAGTTEELLERFLRRHAYSFDALDREAEAGLPDALYTSRASDIIDGLVEAQDLPTPPATRIRAHLQGYADDARRLPLHRFAEAAKASAYDPDALAAQFQSDLPAVFRRLAVLRRPWIEAPQFGLLVVSASGQPLLRRPRPDFALPRHGLACPLWPIFRAFARPGQPLLDRIEHDSGQSFRTFSIALPRRAARFGVEPDLAAHMLIAKADDTGPGQPVGTSCRICTRTDCLARTEPPLLE